MNGFVLMAYIRLTVLTTRLPSIKRLINRFESWSIVQSPIQRLLLSKTRQQSTVAILQKKLQKQRLLTMSNRNTNGSKAMIKKRNEHHGKFPSHWTKTKPEFWIRPIQERILKKPYTFLFQRLWWSRTKMVTRSQQKIGPLMGRTSWIKRGKSSALASRLPKLVTTRSNTIPSCMNLF